MRYKLLSEKLTNIIFNNARKTRKNALFRRTNKKNRPVARAAAVLVCAA